MAPTLVELSNLAVRAAHSHSDLLTIPHLSVRSGDLLCLMGPSGSGKSLLLGTLSGRLPAGVRVSRGSRICARMTRIGLVAQRAASGLHPLIPVDRQLALVTGRTPREVTRILTSLGLESSCHHRRPAELSGGQAQRAAMGLAALSRAAVLLADEPTSALDPHSRDETIALLLSLRREEPTLALVIATHDPEVPHSLGADLIEVSEGRLGERIPA
jgi:peptide/nickel transport system ATP-binding protein